MDTRIVFMGTPDFAASILDEMLRSGMNIVGVVTVPDKPAGRGQKLRSSPVKEIAISHGLPILQPVKLKDPDFISALQELKAEINIVVAFRMLPELVWSIPPLGTFNLHASLLPQYRGAAPINWAIINGEKETGLTTFKIDHKIDTGQILLQDKVSIQEDMSAGDLHDILMNKGASLIIKTIELIKSGEAEFIDQGDFITSNTELKQAPKLFKEDCRINWSQDSNTIHNFIRGLSPFPGAWTVFVNEEGEEFSAKILSAAKKHSPDSKTAGFVATPDSRIIEVACGSGVIAIDNFQPQGKKRMLAEQFLRGYRKELVKVV